MASKEAGGDRPNPISLVSSDDLICAKCLAVRFLSQRIRRTLWVDLRSSAVILLGGSSETRQRREDPLAVGTQDGWRCCSSVELVLLAVQLMGTGIALTGSALHEYHISHAQPRYAVYPAPNEGSGAPTPQ